MLINLLFYEHILKRIINAFFEKRINIDLKVKLENGNSPKNVTLRCHNEKEKDFIVDLQFEPWKNIKKNNKLHSM